MNAAKQGNEISDSSLSSDTTLGQVSLRVAGQEPVNFQLRAGKFYAPITVCHRITSAQVSVRAGHSKSVVRVDGKSVDADGLSSELSLHEGRNIIAVTIIAENGQTQREVELKVFRAAKTPMWERVLDEAPWKARDSAGELVFAGKMWILGGYAPEWSRDVWSSIDGKIWTHESDIPSARGIDIPIAFVFAGKMWIADVDGVLFSSADGKSWTVACEAPPWRGRMNAGCAVFDGRVWIMGGDNRTKLLNDVWCSTDGVNWKRVTEHAPWCARQITHTPVVLDGALWLLGGGGLGAAYHPFIAWNDVWRTTDGERWECVTDDAPWSARIWGSSAVYQDRMWLIGGFRSEQEWVNLGDVWYSTDGKDWRRLETQPTISFSTPIGVRNRVYLPPSDTLWEQRHEQSMFTHDGSLWLAGGMIWPLLNDVWRLTISGLCFVTQPVREAYVFGEYVYKAHADFNESRKALTYRLTRGPAWLRMDGKSGVLRGVPPETGDFAVTIGATDGSGESAEQSFTLHVINCF
jgi:hypothetical protein